MLKPYRTAARVEERTLVGYHALPSRDGDGAVTPITIEPVLLRAVKKLGPFNRSFTPAAE